MFDGEKGAWKTDRVMFLRGWECVLVHSKGVAFPTTNPSTAIGGKADLQACKLVMGMGL